MSLIRTSKDALITLQLKRDLTRSLKRGHPWVFGDALRTRPAASRGAPARLLNKQGRREIARGFYDPQSPLAFRVCTLNRGQTLNDTWAQEQFDHARELRNLLFDEQTTGFRLFNGEGDGLPGLVCDIYGDTAVLRPDGEAAARFWNVSGVARRVAEAYALKCVYERLRVRGDPAGHLLLGKAPSSPVFFLENGIRFTANIIRGQKTGFYLDQRQNRQLIRQFAGGKRVLNVFGYTGGFSVYAGLGGASHVTTVDLAGPALKTAAHHWRLNGLPPQKHKTVTADAFAFLAEAAQQDEKWGLVILDPPSFAPAKKAVPKALSAYRNLIAAGAAVTTSNGLLAAASCSSHIDLQTFLNACQEGVSQARRRATILAIGGQPPDHPAPLALAEFRYLKFVLLKLA